MIDQDGFRLRHSLVILNVSRHDFRRTSHMLLLPENEDEKRKNYGPIFIVNKKFKFI